MKGMDATTDALREQGRALWATVVCFVVGGLVGALVLGGERRPFAGDDSVILPAALVSAVVAAAAFVVSTVLHRAGETRGMPRWQALVSNLSTVAVTVALAGVTALGVLLAGEVLASGLQGLELSVWGGAAFTGLTSAIAGRLAYRLGIDLSTSDLAALLAAYLLVGTLFAMITATDPNWWQRNFSQLGVGDGSWAFNGTLVVAGILIAAIGSYIGRDLHRLRGDAALPEIARVVAAWVLAGTALTAVGLFPIDRMPTAHLIVAIAALLLLPAAAVVTTIALPGAPRLISITTGALVVLTLVAVVLTYPFGILSATALEGIVTVLELIWMSTFVQVLAVLAPDTNLPSDRRSPLHP